MLLLLLTSKAITMPTIENVLASAFSKESGVLDSKKCECNVKLKDTDSHVHGASLMQISAVLLGKLRCVTCNHLEGVRQNQGIGKKLKVYLRY